ncbi:DMT family transporter [Chloroflexi bacterium TSY]|nr:DMT family transporter [Chloroflexi bacterium TSY]
MSYTECAPSNIWLGWLFAISAIIFFSLVSPVARGAIVAGQNPTLLLLLRSLIAFGLIFCTIIFTSPKQLRVSRRELLLLITVGTLNSGSMLCYFWSLSRLDASIASMISALSPLMVLILLTILGERFTLRHGVRLGLALTGLYLLIGPGGRADPIGILLALGAVICFSIHLVLTQRHLSSVDPRTMTLYVIGTIMVGVTSWWLIEGAEWQMPDQNGWLAIIVLAVVTTYLARQALYGAIQRIGSGQVSLLTPLSILLTVIWSVLFLNERLTPLQWVGSSLILSSALLAIERFQIADWWPFTAFKHEAGHRKR